MPYLGNIPATQFAELKYQDFTGGSGTSFTLNDPVGSAQELEVFVNNVRQEPGVAYTVSGTGLTMTGSIASTDDFYVVFQGKSTGTATHPATQNLTAASGTFTNGLTVDDDGATVLTVDRATSNGNVAEFQKDGTTLAQIGAFGVRGYFAADNAGISPYGNVIYPTNGTGTAVDNTVDIGQASYRFKNLYLSGGAYIGGTGAANYLDDVEEGTFTAVLNGGSGHPSTRVNTTGYYTKVNTMVFISINFENISTASYSGSISVFGLPFACGNGAARQVFTIAFYETASFSGTGGSFGHLSATGTEIYLLNNRSGNSWENLTHAAGSGRYLAITGTYSAA